MNGGWNDSPKDLSAEISQFNMLYLMTVDNKN